MTQAYHYENSKGRFYPICHPVTGETIHLPSVTNFLGSVNKARLNDWRERVGKEEASRILKETGDIGNNAHACIERLINGGRILEDEWNNKLNSSERNCIRAYERWRMEEKFIPRCSELTVYSFAHGFAGTLDADGDSKDGHVIADWKTGGIWPNHRLQMVALIMAYLETYPRRSVHFGVIVGLGRDTGLPRVVSLSMDDVRAAIPAVLGALEVWKYISQFD